MRKGQYRTREYTSHKNKRLSKMSQQNVELRSTFTDKNMLQRDGFQIQKQLFLNLKMPPTISSSSWLLFDAKKNEYIGFRQGQQREVASLTKIMTTILTLKLIQKYGLDRCMIFVDLEIGIRVSRSSSIIGGTSAQLKYGKWLKLQDLLYGTMLPSGNDAAYLLCEVMGLLLFYEGMKPEDKQYYDIESIDVTLYDNTMQFVNRFVKQMNKLGKELGLKKSCFANCHGLSNSLNLSSAKDMIELSKYVSLNRQFMEIVNSQEYQCDLFDEDFGDVFQRKIWQNTNKLLKKGWEGIKTGHTPAAGSCLSSLKDGIFIVVLNCCNNEARFQESQILYDWYMRNNNS